MLLDKEVAIITGAGQGIGKSVALRFAKEGAIVILVGRTKSDLEDTNKKIIANNGQADVMAVDLRDSNHVDQLVDCVINKYGKIDILVNNAGISREFPFVEFPIDIWDEVIETNLRTVFLMTKAVLPFMLDRNKGNIVNVGSAAGVRGLPGSTAYSASKAAVIAFTQSLGDEIKSTNIRVNCICPGPVDTELFQKSEKRDYILSAGGDLFDPSTIANGILFLSSKLSGDMNSQVLVMRGFNRW